MGPILGITLLTLAVGVPFAILQLVRGCAKRMTLLGLFLCLTPFPIFMVVLVSFFHAKGVHY
jgi:hypothetical protein